MGVISLMMPISIVYGRKLGRSDLNIAPGLISAFCSVVLIHSYYVSETWTLFSYGLLPMLGFLIAWDLREAWISRDYLKDDALTEEENKRQWVIACVVGLCMSVPAYVLGALSCWKLFSPPNM